MMHPKPQSNSEEAEILAINALGFLAMDSERFQRFMDLSGLDVAAIRAGAANPAFLGGTQRLPRLIGAKAALDAMVSGKPMSAKAAAAAGAVDHLLADESLLLIFAEEQAMRPERIAQLRRKLPGAAVDF